jgi:hypothetical protein
LVATGNTAVEWQLIQYGDNIDAVLRHYRQIEDSATAAA